MGLPIFGRKKSQPAQARDPRELYNAYFPRLFAFVHSCVREVDRATQIIVDSFFDAFASAPSDEDSFRLMLFRAARGRCWPTLKRAKSRDTLTPREREVVALTFDARLSRTEVGRLCRMRDSAVAYHLMKGLSKLRDRTPASLVAAHLNG